MPHEAGGPFADPVPGRSGWLHRTVSEIQVVLGCEACASFEEFVAMVDTTIAHLPAPPTVADRFIFSALLQKILVRVARQRPNHDAVLRTLQEYWTSGSVLDAREFRACLTLLRPASAGHRRTSPHVRRFRTILSQRYSRTELRPSDLAQELNVSLWHLGHLIKRHTGRTILWHLHQFRTSRAAELLSQPELSIKEISALVGYRSTSALDRHFRLFFGVSPSFYRIPVPHDRL